MPQKPPLDFVSPRETERLLKARRADYSRHIRRLRIILPVGAVAVLLLLIFYPMMSGERIATAVMKNIPDLVIDNLHYSGIDNKNQPYSLSALKATRPSGLGNIYDLDKPEGEMTLSNGAWIAGKAEMGRFDQSAQKLWLGGNVRLFHDRGYEFVTDEAQVDLNKNLAWGEKSVLIQGGFGEIRGQGFRVLDNGDTVVVTGPAKAILNLHQIAPSDKPE